MRPYVIISSLVIAALFLGFNTPSNPVYISGHIRHNPKDTSVFLAGLNVFVKGGTQILAKTNTDKNGNFNLSFTPKDEKSFEFFCYGPGTDSILIASIKTFESDTPEMIFYIPAHIKRNALGNVKCLKCNKTDEVYPIRYGDAPIYTSRTTESGEKVLSPIYKGKYQAGACIVRTAKYYCDRDKVKF